MNSYYFPEDIKLAWANALPAIQEFATHNGGKLLRLSFICIGGVVQWQTQMDASPLEPVSQSVKATRSYDWFQVIRALQSAVGGVNGRCMVAVQVVLSPQGEPILWSKPETSLITAVARD